MNQGLTNRRKAEIFLGVLRFFCAFNIEETQIYEYSLTSNCVNRDK